MHQEHGRAMAVVPSSFNLATYKVESDGSEQPFMAPISAWVLKRLGGVVGCFFVTFMSVARTDPALTAMHALLNFEPVVRSLS